MGLRPLVVDRSGDLRPIGAVNVTQAHQFPFHRCQALDGLLDSQLSFDERSELLTVEILKGLRDVIVVATHVQLDDTALELTDFVSYASVLSKFFFRHC